MSCVPDCTYWPTRTVRAAPLPPVRRQVVTTRTITRRVIPAAPAVVAGTVAAAPQPLYDAAVTDQFGVACIGGRGVGFYPNPIAFGESRNTIEATGSQFILDRGYRGCFAVGE